MSLKQINKFTHISGASIYALDDAGHAESEPSAIDTSITLPAIEFETADVNLMGTITLVDHTRVGDISVTASLEADNPQTLKLVGAGLKRWKILWTETKLTPQGLTETVGFKVECAGYVASVPEGAKELGSQAVGDYTMHCMSIAKSDSTGTVYYSIDRAAGKLEVNGADFRKDVNNWL